MGKLRWYKRDPNAALGGMMELSLEERGAYNTILDLIYARDGDVPDDDRFMTNWLCCNARTWRRIRARLIALHKLYVSEAEQYPRLRNGRADVEVDQAKVRAKLAAKAAQTRWSDSSKNSNLADANAMPYRIKNKSPSFKVGDSPARANGSAAAHARRRWETDLRKRLPKEAYAAAVERLATDHKLCTLATTAELETPGSGVKALLEVLGC